MQNSPQNMKVAPTACQNSEKILPDDFSSKTNLQRSFSHAVGDFASRTGMHAVPSIVVEERRTWRLTWGFLLLVALVILTWQVVSLSYKLWLRPTATTIDIQVTKRIPFPAVTICNLNPMRFVALQKFTYEPNTGTSRRKRSMADAEMEKTMETLKEMFVFDNYTRPHPAADETVDFSGSMPPTSMPLNKRVMLLMNSLPSTTLSNLTYSLPQLLVECRFDGRSCDMEKDFVKIISPRYGNCFVFNSGSSPQNRSETAKLKSITRSGSDHGLEMTLLVDQENYLPDFAPAAGVKIIIHSPKRPPIPEDEGFIVSPGFFTSIGIKLLRLQRAEIPYGRCKHFTKAENRSRNMYLNKLPMTVPGEDVCMRTCEQLEIMLNCGCYSLAHGYADSDAFKDVPAEARQKPCGTDGDDSINCEERILSSVSAGELRCKTKKCKYQECVIDRYETSQSMATWPDKKSWRKLASRWMTKSETGLPVLNSETQARENILKVLIAFEDLNVITYKTHPMYGWLDFISDLGGQGGLWLGISIFTICEIFVMIARLGYIVSSYCCNGKEE